MVKSNTNGFKSETYLPEGVNDNMGAPSTEAELLRRTLQCSAGLSPLAFFAHGVMQKRAQTKAQSLALCQVSKLWSENKLRTKF